MAIPFFATRIARRLFRFRAAPVLMVGVAAALLSPLVMAAPAPVAPEPLAASVKSSAAPVPTSRPVAPASAALPVLETLLVQGSRRAPRPWIMQKKVVRSPDASAASLGQMAQTLPGLQLDNRTNHAQDTRLSVRGFGARSAFGVRGVKLYQDQLPLSGADGQGQWPNLPVDQVQSLELVRGPLAGLLGGGSGAAVFIERAPISENQLQLHAQTGTFGSAEQGGSAALARENWQLRAAMSQQLEEGARPHNRAKREQQTLDWYYRASPAWQWQLSHSAARDPLLQDPLGLSAAQWREDPRQTDAAAARFNTRKHLDHSRTSAQLQYRQADWQAQAGLWQGERSVTQYLPIPATGLDRAGGVIDFTRDFYGANLSLGHTHDGLGRPMYTTLGIEWSGLDEDRQGYVNVAGSRGDLRRDERNRVTLGEAYWLTRWALSDASEIYSGARTTRARYRSHDDFVVTDGAVSNPDDSGRVGFTTHNWAGGINWTPAAGVLLALSSGTSHETPTLTEMAYSLDNQGFNRDLAAARSHQWQLELSLEGEALSNSLAVKGRHDWQVGLSGFWIDSDDELLVAASQNGRTVYRNGAATLRRGVELDGRWQPLPQLAISASSSYVDTQMSARRDAPEGFLPGVARFQQQLTLRLSSARLPQLYTAISASHRGKIYADDANQLAAPAFTRWDLTLGYAPAHAARGLETWLSINNLSDSTYVASVIINPSNDRAFEPGLPRQIVAGVRLRL